MKQILLVLVLVVAGVVGLGFFLGWFHIGSDSVDGKSNLTLSVDTHKIQEDKKTAVADVKHLGAEIKDKVAGPSDKSMDGTVVSVSGDKLTMTGKEGKVHSHTLAGNVNVTCDGKTCTALDLKAGMRIRVTMETGDRNMATSIEALNNNQDFAKGA